MRSGPRPAAAIAALPVSKPFIAPEELGKRAGLQELLRLGANESAFGPPPRALDAMQAELPHTAWYGDPESADLREALATRHRCAFENLCVAAGIDDLLGLAVRAYLSPGDTAVTTLGTYPTFVYHVTGYGARLETAPYDGAGRVQLAELAALAHANGARLVYLANPDNPSGSFAEPAAVAQFVAALPPETVLVLDEAYADFVAPAELLDTSGDPRVIRMRTFSKAYGLAGARIGYAIAAPQVVETFQKIRLQYGVNRTAQIGALAALGEDGFVARVVRETAQGREEYYRLGESLGLATLPSSANFVCFDLGSRTRAEGMVEELLRRAVFIRKPGGPPLDRYVRVTVGTNDERVRFASSFTAALQALDAVLAPL
jgi:histidinol-phosphate aminotransferase